MARRVLKKLPTIGRASRFEAFDPNAIDGDSDGIVQELTRFERPATARTISGAMSKPFDINQPVPEIIDALINDPSLYDLAPQKIPSVIFDMAGGNRELFNRSRLRNLTPRGNRTEKQVMNLVDQIRIEPSSDGVFTIIAPAIPEFRELIGFDGDFSNVRIPSSQARVRMYQSILDNLKDVPEDIPIWALSENFGKKLWDDSDDAFSLPRMEYFGLKESLGDEYMPGTSQHSFDAIYERVLRFPAQEIFPHEMFQGEYIQAAHDVVGHLGTGRGFDRHGEWANYLAMVHAVDNYQDGPEYSQDILPFHLFSRIMIEQLSNWESIDERRGIKTAPEALRLLEEINQNRRNVYIDRDTMRQIIGIDDPLTYSQPKTKSLSEKPETIRKRAVAYLHSIVDNNIVETGQTHSSFVTKKNPAVKEKSLRRFNRFDRFDPNAIDADGDGKIQDATRFERPGAPRVPKPSRITGAMARPRTMDERNKNIIEKYNNGQTTRQIAKEFGLQEEAVESVVKVMRKRGEKVRGPIFISERLDEVIRLFDSGKNYQEIADELGFTKGQAVYLLRRYGGAERGTKIKKTITNERQKRNVEIVKMFDSGNTLEEIRKAFGLELATVRQILKDNQRNVRKRNILETQKRNAEIVKMFDSGSTLEQIIEESGLEKGAVRSVLYNNKRFFGRRKKEPSQTKPKLKPSQTEPKPSKTKPEPRKRKPKLKKFDDDRISQIIEERRALREAFDAERQASRAPQPKTQTSSVAQEEPTSLPSILEEIPELYRNLFQDYDSGKSVVEIAKERDTKPGEILKTLVKYRLPDKDGRMTIPRSTTKLKGSIGSVPKPTKSMKDYIEDPQLDIDGETIGKSIGFWGGWPVTDDPELGEGHGRPSTNYKNHPVYSYDLETGKPVKILGQHSTSQADIEAIVKSKKYKIRIGERWVFGNFGTGGNFSFDGDPYMGEAYGENLGASDSMEELDKLKRLIVRLELENPIVVNVGVLEPTERDYYDDFRETVEGPRKNRSATLAERQEEYIKQLGGTERVRGLYKLLLDVAKGGNDSPAGVKISFDGEKSPEQIKHYEEIVNGGEINMHWSKLVLATQELNLLARAAGHDGIVWINTPGDGIESSHVIIFDEDKIKVLGARPAYNKETVAYYGAIIENGRDWSKYHEAMAKRENSQKLTGSIRRPEPEVWEKPDTRKRSTYLLPTRPSETGSDSLYDESVGPKRRNEILVRELTPDIERSQSILVDIAQELTRAKRKTAPTERTGQTKKKPKSLANRVTGLSKEERTKYLEDRNDLIREELLKGELSITELAKIFELTDTRLYSMFPKEYVANKKIRGEVRKGRKSFTKDKSKLVIADIKKGLTAKQLAEKYDVTVATIQKEFGDEFKKYKQERNEKIREEIRNGASSGVVANKYKLARPAIMKIAGDLIRARDDNADNKFQDNRKTNARASEAIARREDRLSGSMAAKLSAERIAEIDEYIINNPDETNDSISKKFTISPSSVTRRRSAIGLEPSSRSNKISSEKESLLEEILKNNPELPNNQIEKITGISKYAINRIRKKLGIPSPSLDTAFLLRVPAETIKAIDKDIRRDPKQFTVEIARTHGVSTSIVKARREVLNLPSPFVRKRALPDEVYKQVDDELKNNPDTTSAAIAKKYGVSTSFVKNRRSSLDLLINPNEKDKARLVGEYGITGVPDVVKDEIVELYSNSELSILDIRKKLKISDGTIRIVLKERDIPLRRPGRLSGGIRARSASPSVVPPQTSSARANRRSKLPRVDTATPARGEGIRTPGMITGSMANENKNVGLAIPTTTSIDSSDPKKVKVSIKYGEVEMPSFEADIDAYSEWKDTYRTWFGWIGNYGMRLASAALMGEPLPEAAGYVSKESRSGNAAHDIIQTGLPDEPDTFGRSDIWIAGDYVRAAFIGLHHINSGKEINVRPIYRGISSVPSDNPFLNLSAGEIVTLPLSAFTSDLKEAKFWAMPNVIGLNRDLKEQIATEREFIKGKKIDSAPGIILEILPGARTGDAAGDQYLHEFELDGELVTDVAEQLTQGRFKYVRTTTEFIEHDGKLGRIFNGESTKVTKITLEQVETFNPVTSKFEKNLGRSSKLSGSMGTKIQEDHLRRLGDIRQTTKGLVAQDMQTLRDRAIQNYAQLNPEYVKRLALINSNENWKKDPAAVNPDGTPMSKAEYVAMVKAEQRIEAEIYVSKRLNNYAPDFNPLHLQQMQYNVEMMYLASPQMYVLAKAYGFPQFAILTAQEIIGKDGKPNFFPNSEVRAQKMPGEARGISLMHSGISAILPIDGSEFIPKGAKVNDALQNQALLLNGHWGVTPEFFINAFPDNPTSVITRYTEAVAARQMSKWPRPSIIDEGSPVTLLRHEASHITHNYALAKAKIDMQADPTNQTAKEAHVILSLLNKNSWQNAAAVDLQFVNMMLKDSVSDYAASSPPEWLAETLTAALSPSRVTRNLLSFNHRAILATAFPELSNYLTGSVWP